jgi:hypothetical protein
MDDMNCFETETDLTFALLALDPFGYACPEDVDYCHFDVELDAVGTEIRNHYFVDS